MTSVTHPPSARGGLGSVVQRELWPSGLLLILVTADLLDGQGQSILGLWVAVPLVAALLAGPVAVGLYAAGSLITAALLGLYDHSYTDAPYSQMERLIFIVAAGVFAISVAMVRQRRERELRATKALAEAVQEVILPQLPPQIGPLRVATSYHAAAPSARVGGDFFDVRANGGVTRIVIGDVRGKGLRAVQLAGAVLAAFRERLHDRIDILDLTDDLNRAVRREADSDEDFVTAVVAELDRGGPSGYTLTMACAGHPPPLRITSDDAAEFLECPASGAALGLLEDRPVTESHRFLLRPGDRLLFYTDGITEARNRSREFFPLAPFALSALRSGTLRQAVDGLDEALQEWTGGRLGDDSALVLLEVVPLPPVT